MTDLVLKAVKKVSTIQPKQANFRSGDTVGVYVKVVEGEKERLQLFKGVVTKVQGRGMTRSFTVRKISEGIGVERTFPINSPFIDRVEILTKGVVRRARLFYLRDLHGKAGKVKSELYTAEETTPEAVAAKAEKVEAKAEKTAARKAKTAAKKAAK